MKKLLLFSLIFLLAVPLLGKASQISNVQVSSQNVHNLWATPELPESARKAEPRQTSEGFAEKYLNTTNPNTNLTGSMSALDEIREREANHPVYVLLVGDEEEREVIRFHLFWNSYACFQLERGDEALISTFGIDIRVIGYLNWDSDDTLITMYDLWYELERDTQSYLRERYDGQYLSNYVDCIIGITSQATTDGTAGLSPGDQLVDEGRMFILLRWQSYWADDNLVQHEVSHIHYADDHDPTCCVMATHTHPQYAIYEDGYMWVVLSDIFCVYTTYSWCNSFDCFDLLNTYRGMYQWNDPPILIDWWDVYDSMCWTRYVWLNERTGATWIEDKGIGMPVATRNR